MKRNEMTQITVENMPLEELVNIALQYLNQLPYVELYDKYRYYTGKPLAKAKETL